VLPRLAYEPPRQRRATRGLVLCGTKNQKTMLCEFPNCYPRNIGLLFRNMPRMPLQPISFLQREQLAAEELDRIYRRANNDGRQEELFTRAI
jgi:hypothetical protein